MLGIIGAMDVEVNALKERVENKEVKTISNIDFVIGTIEGKRVCIAQCSPGKVNAALCTQAMIDNFEIEKIINIGVGCSLDENVVIKDVVVANALCQYDIDITALGEPRGLINGINKIKIESADEFSNELALCAESCKNRVHRGTIASGDTFIATSELKNMIKTEFGAICGEMEGGAIAQVCYINSVPFAILRTISDGGDENAQMDYPSFKKVAAEISCSIILAFLKHS